ncbi:hypothetical protein [Clostridium sp. FP1]|uniref:hypothetical protein n=1 Tax=Clostridium sp. FP1 TaxID=2724076 RepID=UPI0013E96039|nr:hypothetical protein [Clostridium sp. FP1]MBZ9635534.1 hypothetical protein [Clostridium sp. FP1]
MKIRFIEEDNQNNILCETDKFEGLSAVLVPFTQIHITMKNEILICEYSGYNVLRVLENEIDIFVNIIDREEIKSKIGLYKIVTLENGEIKKVKIE